MTGLLTPPSPMQERSLRVKPCRCSRWQAPQSGKIHQTEVGRSSLHAQKTLPKTDPIATTKAESVSMGRSQATSMPTGGS